MGSIPIVAMSIPNTTPPTIPASAPPQARVTSTEVVG